jgi:hypothetical protein
VDKLGNILPRVLRRQPGGARLLGTQVATAFRTLIGVEPARLCEEVELHAQTLVVHQLRLDAETIVERLNNLALGRRVRSLRVRIGRSTTTE